MNRYTYSCKDCGGQVKKAPVGMTIQKKGEPTFVGLGGWKCQKCGSGIKVSRKMN